MGSHVFYIRDFDAPRFRCVAISALLDPDDSRRYEFCDFGPAIPDFYIPIFRGPGARSAESSVSLRFEILRRHRFAIMILRDVAVSIFRAVMFRRCSIYGYRYFEIREIP